MNGMYKILLLSCAVLMFSCKQSGSDSTATNSQTAHPARSGNGEGSLKANIQTTPGKPQQAMQASGNNSAKDDAHLNTGGLQWTTFDQLARTNTSGDKKYLVDVYTEWCGWCKVMDKKTFTDPAIQEYLKKNFHIVKFDAEQKAPVPFKGKQYEWMPGGRRGVNKLAIELLGNRLSYPTLVYLDENMNKITASPGYKTPDQLIQELKAISDMKS